MIVKIFTTRSLDQGTFHFNIFLKFYLKKFIHLKTSAPEKYDPGVLKIDNKKSNNNITIKAKEKTK